MEFRLKNELEEIQSLAEAIELFGKKTEFRPKRSFRSTWHWMNC